MCHVIGFIVEIRKGTSDIKIDTNPKNVGPFEQRKKKYTGRLYLKAQLGFLN